MSNDIPEYLTAAYKVEVERTLASYHILTAGWDQYTPIVLTRKQKARLWLRNKKYELGRYLSNKANDLGYYDDSY